LHVQSVIFEIWPFLLQPRTWIPKSASPSKRYQELPVSKKLETLENASWRNSDWYRLSSTGDGLSPDKVEPSDPIRNRPERSNELVSERAKDKDKAEIRDAAVDQIGHGEQYD
jgi:hypothetical protein